MPLEDLARFRCSENDLQRGIVSENCRELIRFEIDRARQLYRAAAEGLCWLAGDGSRLAAATIIAVQLEMLRAIERQDYDVFSHPPKLTAMQKLRRLSVAWRLAKREADQPLPEIFA